MDVDSNASDTRCHLLSLPPELRLRIYEFHFEQRSLTIYCHGRVQLSLTYAPENNEKPGRANATALLLTCRTIWEEAQPVLLAKTRMVMYIDLLYYNGLDWKSFGVIEDCNFLKSFLSARSWEIRCFLGKGPHWRGTEPKCTAELLESLHWLKGVKELVIRLGRRAALWGTQRQMNEAVECLKRIKCEGAIALIETEVELKEEYNEIVRALGA